MPEERVPAGAQFLGVQKRVAPHLLKPTHSPDCQNCRPYNGMIGRLGPRKGRTKVNSTAYAGRIRGFWPGSGGGGDTGDDYTLFAVDDGLTITVVAESPLWNGQGGIWGGPSFTVVGGFYYEGAMGVVNVPINGANYVIATPPSSEFGTSGTVTLTLTFDLGGALVIEYFINATSGCCGSVLTCAVNADLYAIPAGASKLVNITATAVGDGAQTASGSVTVVGCRI
jgi:hypothetical protein